MNSGIAQFMTTLAVLAVPIHGYDPMGIAPFTESIERNRELSSLKEFLVVQRWTFGSSCSSPVTREHSAS